MQISLEQALKMPDAVLFAQKLDSALKAEKEKRRHFYEIVEEDKKMEFINGEILFHPPSPFCEAKSFGHLLNLLSPIVSLNKLGKITFGKAMISLTRNDYEPDICFFRSEKSEKFTSEQVNFPAPDFVVEVLSKSTAKNDRETKFQDYAAHGVEEYWIIDADKEIVEQYFLNNEKYELLLKSGSGEITSVVLPEFNIPIRAVFDEAENLTTLKNLLD